MHSDVMNKPISGLLDSASLMALTATVEAPGKPKPGWRDSVSSTALTATVEGLGKPEPGLPNGASPTAPTATVEGLGKPEPGLPNGASPTAPTATGEVEIAGRHYVTADRLAAILGVTTRTLSRWDVARIGPPKIKVGKLVLFDLEKVPDWLATRETKPVRASGRRR